MVFPSVRREVRRIGDSLRGARNTEEIWGALRQAAQAMDAAAVALHLADHGAPEDFREGFDEAGPYLFRARYCLMPERPGDSHLELGWSDGRSGVDRDIEIAIELLCDHVSSAVERIGHAAAASERRPRAADARA